MVTKTDSAITRLYLSLAALASTVAVAASVWTIRKVIEIRNAKKRISPDASRCVLITGCDSGFGNLVVKYALSSGFSVVAACYSESGASELKKTIEETLNGSRAVTALTTVVADLSGSEGCQTLASVTKEVCESFGGLYAIVNNAGVCIPGYVFLANPETYREIMKVNFFAAVELTYELLPILQKKQGRVINVTSVDGFMPLPSVAAYSASKAALESFSDCLRIEMIQWGVKVIVIEPSTMKTPLAMRFGEGLKNTHDDAPEERKLVYGKDWLHQVHSGVTEFIETVGEDPSVAALDIIDALELVDPPTRFLSGKLAKQFFKPVSELPDKAKDAFVFKFSMGTLPRPMRLKVPYPPVNKVAFVTIRVSNLERSVLFYQLLGFETVHDAHEGQQFMKSGGDSSNDGSWKPLILLVEDLSMPSPRPGPCHSIGMTRLCIITKNREAEVKRLQLLGVEPAFPLVESNFGKIATFADPDGFVVYFIQFKVPISFFFRRYIAENPVPFHWTVNVKSGKKAKEIFEKLGFKTLNDQNRYQVDEALLPAFGLKGFPSTIIEHIRLTALEDDQFFMTIMEWEKPVSEKAGQELTNSVAISVLDVKSALEQAREAGMVVDDNRIVKKVIPYYGEVRIGRAYVEEGSNPVEFISF